MDQRIVSLHAGYEHDGRFVDGFVARPATGKGLPGLVLVSGMSGLNRYQREMTRVFARGGFVTVSPDLFDGVVPPNQAKALLGKNSLDFDQAIADIAAGADFLHQLPWVGPDAKVGVAGFCLGGGLVLLSLARTDAFRAGVDFYHSLFPDNAELQGIDVPLQCHFGVNDHSTPKYEAEAFEGLMHELGKNCEVHYYPGVGHTFMNPNSDPSPERAEAASLAQERAFAFLHRELSE